MGLLLFLNTILENLSLYSATDLLYFVDKKNHIKAHKCMEWM